MKHCIAWSMTPKHQKNASLYLSQNTSIYIYQHPTQVACLSSNAAADNSDNSSYDS